MTSPENSNESPPSTSIRSARLILSITVGSEETDYDLLCFNNEAQWSRPTWRLVKSPTESYDVHQDKYGCHCTCPDANWRHKDGSHCKHVLALIDRGILRND